MCEIIWFIYIILWGNWNLSNICYIYLFEELLSYYTFYSLNNLIMYLVLSEILVFISTSSNFSLCPSLVYLKESPIWKGEVGVLVCVESLQTLFDELNRGLFNLFETTFLITSSSTYGVKCIWLHIIGSYLLHMEEKVKLNVEDLEIDPNIFQNLEKLLKPYCISNPGRQSFNWVVVCLYLPKSQVKI